MISNLTVTLRAVIWHGRFGHLLKWRRWDCGQVVGYTEVTQLQRVPGSRAYPAVTLPEQFEESAAHDGHRSQRRQR